MTAHGDSPATQAHLIRLRFATSFELNDVLKELLDRNQALEQVAEIVESKIDDGHYIVSEYLARLLAVVRVEALFVKSYQQLFSDDGALLILYKARYPGSNIEQKLSETLYRIASDDANPMRRQIAEAMTEVGSDLALAVLEAINFDLAPSVKAREIFGQAVEPISEATEEFGEKLHWKLPRLEAASRTAFLEVVTAAIAAIKARSGPQAN